MPAEVEINSAGIWATSPSPIVNNANNSAASPKSSPCCNTPIRIPPTISIKVIMRPAIASPLTNLLAPSIAP